MSVQKIFLIVFSVLFISNFSPAKSIELKNGSYDISFLHNSDSSTSQVLRLIQSGKKEILVVSSTINESKIVDALVAASKKKITVRIVLDASKNISKKTKKPHPILTKLLNQKINVKLLDPKSLGKINSRFIIIDSNSVASGSIFYKSSKNMIKDFSIFSDVPDIAKIYHDEFDLLWAKANLYTPN